MLAATTTARTNKSGACGCIVSLQLNISKTSTILVLHVSVILRLVKYFFRKITDREKSFSCSNRRSKIILPGLVFNFREVRWEIIRGKGEDTFKMNVQLERTENEK